MFYYIQTTHCKRGRLWARLPHEEMKWLILIFFPSGVEAKRGVEFRYSYNATYNVLRIRRKMENGVS